MTKSVLTTFGVILIAAMLCLAATSTSQAALSTGLVLYNPMNNITPPTQANYWQDVSGNGFHAQTNPPTYNGTSDPGGANRGTAIDFTTITAPQYNPNQITFADGLNPNLDPGTTDFSFSFWYNQTELDAADPAATRFLFTKGNLTSGAPGFIVYTKGGAVSLRSQDISGDDSGKFSLQHLDELETPVNLVGTGWRHVAGVFDRSGTYRPADSVTLYVDGTPVNTGVLPFAMGLDFNNVSAPTSPLFIGGKNGGVSKDTDFDGYMDDMAFYRGALSDAQVLSLYQATSFNASTVSGVTPVFVHNFETNANTNTGPATVPNAHGDPGLVGVINGDVTQVTDATRGEVLSINSRATTNRVTYGDNLDPSTTSYTVSLWFKPDGGNTATEFIASNGNRSSGQSGWSLFHKAGGVVGIRGAYVDTVTGQVAVDDDRLQVEWTEGVTPGEWHHLALVIDQETGLWQGYLNGVGSGTDGGNSHWEVVDGYSAAFPNDGTANFVAAGTQHLTLGRAGETYNPFQGDTDDFAIWTRALTAAEILAIYQGADILAPSFDIPGDADGNGIVNEADAKRLAENWGATVLNDNYATFWEMGDFNGDGKIDARDAAILAANWGWGSSIEATASVPEPGMLALLSSLVCLMATLRGRKQ